MEMLRQPLYKALPENIKELRAREAAMPKEQAREFQQRDLTEIGNRQQRRKADRMRRKLERA